MALTHYYQGQAPTARAITVLFLLILFGSFCCRPMAAQNDFAIDDSTLNERFDWVIFVNVKELKSYLNYKGSTLNPVAKLSITYRQTPRFNKERELKMFTYEDLWYHEGSAVGCRRYHELKLNRGEQGAIRIMPSQDADNEPAAIANAITRILLDVGLNRSSVASVFTPKNALKDITYELEKFNFVPYVPRPDSGVRGQLSLFLSSDPPGQNQYLFFKPM